MKIEVNVSKKVAFSVIGAVLVLAGAIVAIAYGTSNPANFGHSAGEVEGASFGDWIPVTNYETTQTAQTDGIVIADVEPGEDYATLLKGYINNNQLVQSWSTHVCNVDNPSTSPLVMPVKKGSTWKVTKQINGPDRGTGCTIASDILPTITVYWVPK